MLVKCCFFASVRCRRRHFSPSNCLSDMRFSAISYSTPAKRENIFNAILLGHEIGKRNESGFYNPQETPQMININCALRRERRHNIKHLFHLQQQTAMRWREKTRASSLNLICKCVKTKSVEWGWRGKIA